MMLFLLLLSFQTIELQTNGQPLLGVISSRSSVNSDGSYLFASRLKVRHFNADGSLRLQFGNGGQGPNEYQYITGVAWDGEYYWVSDGGDLRTTVVNRDGAFVKKIPAYFSRLICNDGSCWGVVERKSRASVDDHYYIEELKFGTSYKQGERFHAETKILADLSYNWTNHHVSLSGNNLYVMNELEPVVGCYQRPGNTFLKKVAVALPGFAEAPSKMANFQEVGPIGWEKFWCSFSKITGFSKTAKGYVVAYEIPDPNDDRASLLMVAKLDQKGKAVGKKVYDDAFFLGVHDGAIHVFVIKDDDSKRPQFIEMIKLKE